jgi:hypothetical protein
MTRPKRDPVFDELDRLIAEGKGDMERRPDPDPPKKTPAERREEYLRESGKPPDPPHIGRNSSGQFASPVKTPEFELYGGRPCFDCHAPGDCPHRERDVFLAALFAFQVATGQSTRNESLPAPVFEYLQKVEFSSEREERAKLPPFAAVSMKYPALSERKPVARAEVHSKKRRKAMNEFHDEQTIRAFCKEHEADIEVRSQDDEGHWGWFSLRSLSPEKKLSAIQSLVLRGVKPPLRAKAGGR